MNLGNDNMMSKIARNSLDGVNLEDLFAKRIEQQNRVNAANEQHHTTQQVSATSNYNAPQPFDVDAYMKRFMTTPTSEQQAQTTQIAQPVAEQSADKATEQTTDWFDKFFADKSKVDEQTTAPVSTAAQQAVPQNSPSNDIAAQLRSRISELSQTATQRGIDPNKVLEFMQSLSVNDYVNMYANQANANRQQVSNVQAIQQRTQPYSGSIANIQPSYSSSVSRQQNTNPMGVDPSQYNY